jgi:rhodanese-related sulfurtransferase
VIGVALLGGCAERITAIQVIKDISVKEVYDLIGKNKDNQDFIIIDVRTPQEFSNEHIGNALNLDYYSEKFRDELNKLDKEKTYLIYCRSGNRSGKALSIMKELTFREVYNMLGGVIQWKAEGYPL